ncbi:hypothetical protein GCM10023096_24960 [Nonomuraea ferruginea]
MAADGREAGCRAMHHRVGNRGALTFASCHSAMPIRCRGGSGPCPRPNEIRTVRVEHVTGSLTHHSEGVVRSDARGGLRGPDLPAGDVPSFVWDETAPRRRMNTMAAAVHPCRQGWRHVWYAAVRGSAG